MHNIGKHIGYRPTSIKGAKDSYEKELFDMARSVFLKVFWRLIVLFVLFGIYFGVECGMT